jgi:hypothetical protein
MPTSRQHRFVRHYGLVRDARHEALPVIDPEKKLIPTLDKLRKKRNTGSYDDFGLVSEGEAPTAAAR